MAALVAPARCFCCCTCAAQVLVKKCSTCRCCTCRCCTCRCCTCRCCTCIARVLQRKCSTCSSILVKGLCASRRALVLYMVTFAIILPLLCRNLHNSMYLRRAKNDTSLYQNAMREENSQRIREAESFLANFSHAPSAPLAIANPIQVSIGVITVSRNRHKVDDYEPHYLSQVVARLLQLAHEYCGLHAPGSCPLDLRIMVCDVDPEPGSYAEAHSLERIVPTVHHYKQKRPKKKLHSLEKEKQDYVYCLNTSLRQQPQAGFVLLVEDDALPTEDLFHVLHHTITRHLVATYHGGLLQAPPSEVAYVKFYHPPHLLSYVALERERLTELLGLGAVLGTVTTLLYCWVHKTPYLYRTWLILVIYWMLVALTVGRTNVQELRRFLSPHFYSYTPAPSCCTPAMMFPRLGALKVLQHLSNITCGKNYGKDSALDELVAKTSWRSHLVQPNCFTHIGMYSSLRARILDPFIV